jgi:hypothetical protein
MDGENACPKSMKNNSNVKKILLKQHCLECGNARGFWKRLISTDRSLCEECLHLLQRESREACREAETDKDKKAG